MSKEFKERRPNIKRYRRIYPHHGSKDYKLGKEMAEIAIERYHILKACLQQKYEMIHNTAPSMGTQIFPVQQLDFSAYKDFKIKRTQSIKFRPLEDGTIDASRFTESHRNMQDDWKVSEGDILYSAVTLDFFLPILNYNSISGTTGSEEWDKLFGTLKEKNYPADIIPCMFFARDSGCWDPDCPFLHDEARARAKRSYIIEERRKCMLSPTSSQRFGVLGKPGARDDEPKAVCANPKCWKPWYDDTGSGISPMSQCSKCKWSFYCSKDCQVADWKRHKQEPCAPLEDIVEDDDLWSPIGSRKGTDWLNMNWG